MYYTPESCHFPCIIGTPESGHFPGYGTLKVTAEHRDKSAKLLLFCHTVLLQCLSGRSLFAYQPQESVHLPGYLCYEESHHFPRTIPQKVVTFRDMVNIGKNLQKVCGPSFVAIYLAELSPKIGNVGMYVSGDVVAQW